MTRSEFFLAVLDEFGDAQGRSLVRELVLGDLGHHTAEVALDDGIAPKQVWAALCDAMGVPRERRHGVGQGQPLHDTPS